MTDLDRIAPCMPGAVLEGQDGDKRLGKVKVKVGPITAEYRGMAHFVELDAPHHRAVLHAAGRDSRGQGSAQADIVVKLLEEPGATRVHVETELSISGEMAQFGRGVLDIVSARLLDQFVVNLRTMVGELDASTVEAPGPDAVEGLPLGINDVVPGRTIFVACSVLAAVVLVGVWVRRSRCRQLTLRGGWPVRRG